MKPTLKILLIAMLLQTTNTLQAQTFQEWFQQKKTQLKYLGVQIAELQVYIGHIKKGYDIAQAGLKTIHKIKDGEFGLHDLYYTSLKNVNPSIRNAPQAKGIIAHQLYIIRSVSDMKKFLGQDNSLPVHQKKYITECLYRLLVDVEKTRKLLIEITADNNLELTDDERITRINDLYTQSTSQFVFVQSFSRQVYTLLQEVKGAENDQQLLRELYNISE